MADLRSGAIQSCKCLMREKSKEANTTHGQAAGKKNKLYRTWNMMRQRCTNPNNPRYHRYGGRGIKLCESWDSFEKFAEDVGPLPKGLDLYRINSNEDFGPTNFKWSSTAKETDLRKINPEDPKTCYKCLQLKPIDQFYRQGRQRYRRRSCCIACLKQYRLDNHDRIIAKERKNREARKDTLKKTNRFFHLKLKYGLSVEQYDKLLALQNGVCAICGKKPIGNKPLYVDHCHAANHVRGLLCGNCNTAEGLIRTVAVAMRLVEYMQKNQLFENSL